MSLYIMGVAEVQALLPEFLPRVAAGDQVIIVEGGKPLARLVGPLPAPSPPEPDAAKQARAREAIRETLRGWVADGVEIPPDHPLAELLREGA